MLRQIATIAHFTLIEALRGRLLWVIAALGSSALALALFAGQLALTESAALQASLLGAILRLAGALLVAAFVVTSIARETADKGQQLLLALALTRAAYVLGKLAGFGLVALLTALVFSLLAMGFAPLACCALWGLSLLCELWIVAAFSLLCALGLGQVLPSLAGSCGFYLLARGIGGVQQMEGSDSGRAMRLAIDSLAALLPRLDNFARSDWLAYHDASLIQLWPVLAQSAIYITLLTCAVLIDFQRKAI